MKTVHIDCLGYSLSADWYEGESTNEVILFLMGFRSTKKRQEGIVHALVEGTGRSALVIDYSGHGDSPFELRDIRPAQHLVEVITTYDWIKDHSPDAQVSVVSASYGSFLAAHLINYRAVEQLVLRAPAIYRPESLYDVWGDRFTDEDTYAATITAYRSDAYALETHPILVNAKRYNGKTMVVVHSDDEVIPPEVTDVYTGVFQADTYTAEGFRHAISHSNPTDEQLTAYYGAITGWINENSR